MRPCLERADRGGLGRYLETTLPRNLPFYEGQGFMVTEEVAVDPGKIPVRLMWRDPVKTR
jgi:hypothetical protein